MPPPLRAPRHGGPVAGTPTPGLRARRAEPDLRQVRIGVPAAAIRRLPPAARGPGLAHPFRLPLAGSTVLHGILLTLLLLMVARAVPPLLPTPQSVQVVFAPHPAPPVPAPAPPAPAPPAPVAPPPPAEPAILPNASDVPPPPPPLPAPLAELPPPPPPLPAPLPIPVPQSPPLQRPRARPRQHRPPAQGGPPSPPPPQPVANAAEPAAAAPQAGPRAAPRVAVVAARPIGGIEGNCQPEYPAAAQRRREGGEVILRVTVGPDGRALSVAIGQSSGHPVLDRAAAEKVLRDCRFYPATSGGVPIAGTALQAMNFVPPP